ncbi:MAG: PepSY domain-containing protein [Cyclobacteriaceae bacterium]|nr:PepSY domain-containing protein [Cyclobacteriaceae bacterium]
MNLNNLISRLRQFRSLHHWVGIAVVLFMFISSVTGLLLGWKKNVDLLQPPTRKGASTDVAEWITYERVVLSANRALDSVRHEHPGIERIDARPDKGIVKVVYLNYWEVQVDGKTGKALSVAPRHADWIEHIHDGSILSEGFKLFYTNYIGWGLLIMSVTGFWLWYGPRKIRQVKQLPEN